MIWLTINENQSISKPFFIFVMFIVLFVFFFNAQFNENGFSLNKEEKLFFIRRNFNEDFIFHGKNRHFNKNNKAKKWKYLIFVQFYLKEANKLMFNIVYFVSFYWVNSAFLRFDVKNHLEKNWNAFNVDFILNWIFFLSFFSFSFFLKIKIQQWKKN